MSNHLISEVYKRQVGNIARKAVMVLFADKASDDGSGIWASKQRMADEIGASKQTVISTIKALTDEGLVRECGQRKSPNGYTVEYAINVAALRALPMVRSHCDDQSENLTGQNPSPVKKPDPTSQAALPHRSKNLTQTPLNPPKPSEQKTQKARKRVMPDDWVPEVWPPGSKCHGIIEGWPSGEYETQVEHFTAHHRSKGSQFIDWQDAWKTWVLNSRKWNNGNNGRNSGAQHSGTTARQPADRRDGVARALDRRLGLDGSAGQTGQRHAGPGEGPRLIGTARPDPLF